MQKYYQVFIGRNVTDGEELSAREWKKFQTAVLAVAEHRATFQGVQIVTKGEFEGSWNGVAEDSFFVMWVENSDIFDPANQPLQGVYVQRFQLKEICSRFNQEAIAFNNNGEMEHLKPIGENV